MSALTTLRVQAALHGLSGLSDEALQLMEDQIESETNALRREMRNLRSARWREEMALAVVLSSVVLIAVVGVLLAAASSTLGATVAGVLAGLVVGTVLGWARTA